MTEDINELIDNAIDQLSDDRVDAGVEALHELAVHFKTKGMGAQFFKNICEYIEAEASKKSDETFVQMKIHNALVRVRERKNGSVILRPLH